MAGSVSISSGEATADEFDMKGAKITVLLNSSATLWGGKILQSEGAKLSNNFFLVTATELLKRAGFSTSSRVKYDVASEEITITIV